MSHFEYKESYSRNLPHLQPPEATLFLTFRLFGSIPKSVLDQWLREKKELEAERSRRAALPSDLSPADEGKARTRFQRRWFARFESLLHAGSTGPLWLAEEPVAEIVSEALHHRDGKVYRLDAFCIMPNHVHAVFAPLMSEAKARRLAEAGIRARRAASQTQTNSLRYPEAKARRLAEAGIRARRAASQTQTNSLRYLATDDSVLSATMQSLKGYTARKCNLALGRSGSFWQHESFDRVIRDDEEFDRTIRYVLNNPVAAGLAANWRDWPWTYCRGSANC